MKKKKKGISIIEVIVGLAIICVLFSISSSLIISSNKTIKKREEIIVAERIAYGVIQEIKYNYTIDQLTLILQNEHVKLSSNNFLKNIKTKKLFECTSGDDIIVNLLQGSNEECLKLSVTLISDSGEKIVERYFNKYKWMDIDYE